METRDEPDLDSGSRRRSAPTRRAFLAAAGLLGTLGAVAIGETSAKRRGRKNQGRNKNQSNATSVGQGGAGGAGGDAGAVTYVCDPGFENCVPIDD